MNPDFIAYLASAIAATVAIPQAVRAWKMRHDPVALAGVSWGTPALSLVTAGLWIWWAISVEQLPSVAYTVVTVPVGALSMFLVLRYRATARTSSRVEATGPEGLARPPVG